MLTQDLRNLLRSPLSPKWVGTVSEWSERFIRFREPGKVGAFTLEGREYLREPLDCYSDDEINDLVICFGTRTGKTTILYAGLAFSCCQEVAARRALCVKPTTKGTAGAEGDARTRWIPTLKASPELSHLIPVGAARHNFKTAQQFLTNGSIVDWTGSNSVANLASNSMEVVSQDEVDKFNASRRRDQDGKIVEADACDLADERTMEFPHPKRVKASTPTLESGRIWVELLKTDLRRRFIPCPLCGRHHPSSRGMVLAWSKEFTLLPQVLSDGTPIPLAFVHWAPEARRADGRWDLLHVEQSAAYVCPHCGGKFRDEHKAWMDANGVWKPTKSGAPRSRGYHLPSMYAAHEQMSVGRLAVEFLEALQSVEGPRNLINSRFAEPYLHQGISINRAGLATERIELTKEWLPILSVDYHQNAPYFWAVVRAWNGSDRCHGLAYRSFNQWSELDELQQEFKVIPEAVIVDTGFNFQEVLQECSALKRNSRCTLVSAVQGGLPEVSGWNPCKAFGGKKLYRDEATGLYFPYRLKKDCDPYAGTEMAHQMRIELLEFLSDVFEDMLEKIRIGRTGLRFTLAPEMDTDEYHRHMSGKVRRFSRKDPRAYKWETVTTGFPDHIRSCELMNLVLAYRLKLISFDAVQAKEVAA